MVIGNKVKDYNKEEDKIMKTNKENRDKMKG